MRRIFLTFVLISAVLFIVSCARGLSPEQAANGRVKCGKNYVR